MQVAQLPSYFCGSLPLYATLDAKTTAPLKSLRIKLQRCSHRRVQKCTMLATQRRGQQAIGINLFVAQIPKEKALLALSFQRQKWVFLVLIGVFSTSLRVPQTSYCMKDTRAPVIWAIGQTACTSPDAARYGSQSDSLIAQKSFDKTTDCNLIRWSHKSLSTKLTSTFSCVRSW